MSTLTARNNMSRKNQSFSGHGGQEREHFAKVVYTSLSKVINNKEVPPKQKHVRIAVMSTHKERCAATYWGIVTTMGLQGNDLTAYKFCHVTHNVLRDGHPNVLPESAKHIPFLDNLSRLWSNMADGYGRTTAFYCDLLVTKIKFHERNPAFPGNLQFEDIATFETEYLSYPDNLFNLCAELFDYLEAILSLQVQIFNLVERGRWGTASAQSQCLLSPLVPIIQDACQLYDLIVRSMYKLHSSIPSDLLQGHSQRFNQMFPTTKNFFQESARLTYVKSFMQLPSLNVAPDFSRVASTLASKQHYAPVKMIAQPEEDDYYYEDSSHSTSTLPSNINDTLIEFEPMPVADFNGAVAMEPPPPAIIPRSSPATLLNNLNDVSLPTRSPPPIPPLPPQFNAAAVVDSRLLEQEKEIARLRSEIEYLTEENGQLREENQKKEDEVNEQINEIHINFLQIKAENQQLKKLASESKEKVEQLEQELQMQKEQSEAQLKASNEKFQKMTDIYAKLREEHLALLRSKGELQRHLSSLGEKARAAPTVDQSKQEELEKLRLEISLLHQQLAELEESNSNSQTDLQQTKLLYDQLQTSVNASRDECSSLQDKIERLRTLVNEFVRNCLLHVETPSIVIPNVTPGVLIVSIEQVITEWDNSRLSDDLVEHWVKIAFQLNECSSLIASVLQFYPITAKVRESLLSCIQKCATSFEKFLDSRASSKSVCNGEDTLISFGDDSNEEGAPQCLRDLLQLVKELEAQETASEAAPSAADLEKILEDEMRTASRAIDDASTKFQDLLRQSSEGDDVKLQVHTTVLESCTKLMTLIKRLMIAVKVMQDQMVAKGECKSSKDFYAKNSVWTEGLISGGKSLGLSATMLLEAADSAVKGSGSFVALKACGKGIISATAHLLMAAKVKGTVGDRVSSGEKELQSLAKQVQSATGEVIASAQQAQQLQDDKMLMDFSGLSLHQAKQMEMESHIKLLELEASVQRERSRLGELRRRHYELAAAASKPTEDESAFE